MTKNILFYYHHFGGLGHGMRIYSLCKAIKKIFPNVILIVVNSGVPQPELNIERYAKVINLPYFKAGHGLFSGLYSPEGLEITFKRRRAILRHVAGKFRFDIAIFEHFPFGRDSLHREIIEFINYLKEKKTLIYSSVRDIIVQKISQGRLHERLRHFDGIFVHSDKNMGFITSFRKFKILNEKIIFTGRIYPMSKEELISKRNIKNRYKHNGKKLIAVNIGGGIDGVELIKKIIQIKNKIDRRVKIFCLISTGPSIKENIFQELNSYIRDRKDMVIKKFIPSYPSYITAADLSISMGGYNSINNALFTNTKTIIFPRSSDSEQQIRAKYFSKYFNILDFRISHRELASKIRCMLKRKSLPAYNVKFKGAQTFARLLDRILNLNYMKIRLTTKCNLNCDMCSWKHNKEQLNYLDVLRLIDQAKSLNVKTINFTGGEPTLYPQFYKLIRYVKKQGLFVSLSTNGIVKKNDLLYLTRYLDFIDISINSHKQEVDDKIRGAKGAFRNSIETIQYLDKLNKGIRLHVNVTVRPDNFKDIHKMVRLLCKFINSISFTLVDANINNLEYLKFKKEELLFFYFREVPLILKECMAGNIKSRITPFFSVPQSYSDKDGLDGLPTGGKRAISSLESVFKPAPLRFCLRAREQLRINCDGEVSPCCYLDDYPVNLGNIYKENLSDIISSDKYFNFVFSAKANRGICKRCMAGYKIYSKLLK